MKYYRIYQVYDGNNINNNSYVNINSARSQTGNDFGNKSGNINFNNTMSSVGGVDPNAVTAGYLASTFYNTNSVALGIPKNNSLTDSFLRSTLGC